MRAALKLFSELRSISVPTRHQKRDSRLHIAGLTIERCRFLWLLRRQTVFPVLAWSLDLRQHKESRRCGIVDERPRKDWPLACPKDIPYFTVMSHSKLYYKESLRQLARRSGDTHLLILRQVLDSK